MTRLSNSWPGPRRMRAPRPGGLRLWVAALICASTLAAGCEEQRRVPYIRPELHDWPRPYRGVRRLRLHVFQTGTMTMAGAMVVKGGGLTRQRELPVWAYVLEHPKQGPVVIETGLDPGLLEEGSKGLGPILDATVSLDLRAGEDLQAQMRAAGLSPEKVRWVLLSNLRFYHAGAADAFPDAQVVVSRAEHEAARRNGGAYGPVDVEKVSKWELLSVDVDGQPLGTMTSAVDLFGDGSCMVIDAAGPTPGNLAFLLRLPTRPLLLAGDLAPVEETLRYAAEPASLRDPESWWQNIWRLKRFDDLEPELLVLPGFEAEILLSDVPGELRWHEPTPLESTPARTPRPTRRPRNRSMKQD